MATSTRRERMSKIAPENMSDAQRKAAAELASGPRGEVRGPFNVLLRSPELMSPLQKVGEYLRFKCEVDRRIAEMATLIAARQLTQPREDGGRNVRAAAGGHPVASRYGCITRVTRSTSAKRTSSPRRLG